MILSDSKPRPVTHSKPREKLHPCTVKCMLAAGAYPRGVHKRGTPVYRSEDM